MINTNICFNDGIELYTNLIIEIDRLLTKTKKKVLFLGGKVLFLGVKNTAMLKSFSKFKIIPVFFLNSSLYCRTFTRNILLAQVLFLFLNAFQQS